ncbi:MAG: hypothetical protein DMF96_22270 [Acidobacteria bacterium]|nr:MAG: hypothetical protein DMF96_22270 [Acidobacteriota bacterium]
MSEHARQPSGILMVTGAYFPELSGGGLQCKATIDALHGALRFTVLTTSTDASLPVVSEVDGTLVYRANVDVTSRWSKAKAAWAFLWSFLKLSGSFDIVHLHGFSQKSTLLVLLAKMLGKSIVLTLHTAGQDEPAGVRARGRLAYWAYSHVDLFMAVSPPLADRLEDAGFSASRVCRGTNGLDMARFHPAEPGERIRLRRTLALPESGALILFVGFFSLDKGAHVLFEAWRRIANGVGAGSSLVYVGSTRSRYHEIDPALADRIRDAAGREGLANRIVFVEETRVIDQYYRAADVFVFPSRREAFGMALVEAMASGLPCIASRLPGVTDDIVKDGETGLLVEPHDANALAAALARVLTDCAFASRLGRAGRQAVDPRFAIERTAHLTLDAYRRVLNTPTLSVTS